MRAHKIGNRLQPVFFGKGQITRKTLVRTDPVTGTANWKIQGHRQRAINAKMVKQTGALPHSVIPGDPLHPSPRKPVFTAVKQDAGIVLGHLIQQTDCDAEGTRKRRQLLVSGETGIGHRFAPRNPQFYFDVFIFCELRPLTSAWMGHSSFEHELEAGKIELIGKDVLARNLKSGLSEAAMLTSSKEAPDGVQHETD